MKGLGCQPDIVNGLLIISGIRFRVIYRALFPDRGHGVLTGWEDKETDEAHM